MAYSRFDVEIAIPTLIMHNARLANPLDTYTKRIKEISSKRKKVDADFAALADLEYEGSLYLDQTGTKVVIPGRVFEAAIAEGARKSKEGKQALSGLFVDNDAEITYEGGPLTVKELVASPAHRLVVGVKVQKNRVQRTRPLFKDVRAKFTVSLDLSVANAKSLQTWIEAAITQAGIGDWRPRYGRGALVSFEAVSVPKPKLTAAA